MHDFTWITECLDDATGRLLGGGGAPSKKSSGDCCKCEQIENSACSVTTKSNL